MATSLKASVGPWNSSSRNVFDAKLRDRRDRRMAEGAIGLARDAREIGVGNAVARERADHLDRDLGIGAAGKATRWSQGCRRGQVSGT